LFNIGFVSLPERGQGVPRTIKQGVFLGVKDSSQGLLQNFMIFSLIITRDFCLLVIQAIALLQSSLTFWLADALLPKEIGYFDLNDRKV
jgi:hypothetical protein